MVVNKEDVTLSIILGAIISKDYLKPGNNKASDLGVEESDSEVVEFVRIYSVLTVMDLFKIRSCSDVVVFACVILSLLLEDTLGTTPKGGVLLGPERPYTYDDLNENEKKRFNADVCASNNALQGLPKDIYKLINHNIEAKAIWDNVKMILARSELNKEDIESQLFDEFECFKMLQAGNGGNGAAGNGGAHIRDGNPKHQLNSDYFKDKLLLTEAQENDAADKCDAFDSDVDDEPTAQSIFMVNFSSAGPTNQQTGPSNASILSEVHDLENAIDPFNDVSVVPSCASSISNDAYVLHDNDAYVPHDPLVTKLNIYKEQVAIYEQRARFELTLREQKIDEQMSILIQDRNKKEENLKKELHSVKLQVNSTIQNN
uniref:Integrase, catalytic region, zinc finger, CCHC-type, peptidase aspartic, catalytic n=1 Tax=Tanacetum cinerariifolium TaxID=118510 RepID=A0A6L2K1Q3_TANCI|nr:hypothetical protein [Tanacetum cinerariifolium]